MNEFNYEGWVGGILDNYTSVSEFPDVGSENTLYIVRDGGEAQLYVWDNETSSYIEFAGGGGGGGGAQSDWEDNDPTSNSYVKNRTHWTEETLEERLSDKVQKMYYDTDVFHRSLSTINYLISPKYTYDVTVDGVTKTMAPYIVNGGATPIYALGNSASIVAAKDIPSTYDDDFIWGGVPYVSGDTHVMSGLFGHKTLGEHTLSITCTGNVNPDYKTLYFYIGNVDLTGFDITTITPGQTYTIYEDGVAHTAHCQSLDDSGNMIMLGNVSIYIDVLKQLYPEQAADLHYDETLDVDLDFMIAATTSDNVIVALQFAFNSPDSRTIQVETSVENSFSSDNMLDALLYPSGPIYDYIAEGTFTDTYTVTDDYDWFRSVWVQRINDPLLVAGDTYRITLGSNTYDVVAVSNDNIETFNDGAGYRISQGITIGDPSFSQYPFYIVSYLCELTQYFGELHLSDSYGGGIQDFKIERLASSTVHQLPEKFIPNTIARTSDIPDIKEVTLDDLFEYICMAHAESDGKEHTYVIKSDENGDIPTVAAFKTSMINYLDTEAARAFIYKSGRNTYLTFNLIGQKTIESGSYNVGSKSIPLQVNYEIKTDPETGDSYIDPHVYSLEVITENNQLKVVPVEATGPISGFVRLRKSS